MGFLLFCVNTSLFMMSFTVRNVGNLILSDFRVEGIESSRMVYVQAHSQTMNIACASSNAGQCTYIHLYTYIMLHYMSIYTVCVCVCVCIMYA